MKFFTDMLKYFVSITTGTVLIFIVEMLISGSEGVTIKTLAEMPLMGLLTAFITAAILREEASGRQFVIRQSIHYVLITVTMSVFAVLFGWVDFTVSGILMIVLGTAAVYAFTYLMTYLLSKKEADELNSALRRKRSERE